MIQRIQTVFLALAALASGGLFGLPFARTPQADADSGLFADSIFNINDHLVLLVSFLLGGAISLMAIFLYRNRKLQMNLSLMTVIAAIIGAGYGLFIFFSDPARSEASFGLGTLLPVLMIVFALLGRRHIKKDDKLVKSMDRLR